MLNGIKFTIALWGFVFSINLISTIIHDVTRLCEWHKFTAVAEALLDKTRPKLSVRQPLKKTSWRALKM